MSVWLDHHILHGKLLVPRPADDGFRHFDPLLIRQRDGEGEVFPWSHGQITRESPAGTRQVPDGALAIERTRVVRDRALHREAAEGTNREERLVA